jgi:hypothetical protein
MKKTTLRVALYGVATRRFGTIFYQTSGGITAARTWARTAHGVRSRSAVWRHVTYRHCEWCDSKPCLCRRAVR